MGAIILSTGVSTDSAIKSSIAHSVAAGRQAIERAGIKAEDVALVINVGVYRDNNMVEPAMAALIQKELGMNPDYIKAGTGKDAFSLDLMNGGIGALNALQVASSFVQSGSVKYALIVGADAHPSNQEQSDFPYGTVGSAILLTQGKDAGKGFQAFDFDTKEVKQHGRLAIAQGRKMGTKGREHLHIETQNDFIPNALSFLQDKAKAFVTTHKIDKAKTKTISSQLNADFAKKLGEALGLSSAQIGDSFAKYGDTHSSTFGLLVNQLESSKALKSGDQLLFLGATSGLSVGCASYVAP